MSDLYYWYASILSSWLCIVIDMAVFALPDDPPDFTGVQILVSWVSVVFFDSTIFPTYFMGTFAIYLISYPWQWLIRLLKTILELIPFL